MSYLTLLEKNKVFLKQYSLGKLMLLLDSDLIDKLDKRAVLLDCIQIFSNYFQKVMMLRLAFTDAMEFVELAQEHLDEEYGHNKILSKERESEKLVWDPILESCSAWFSWKMLTLDNVDKTFLVHMVLESSANVFFKKASEVMKKYGSISYFNVHSEHDERHAQMGQHFLEGLRYDEYNRLLVLQDQAWSVLFALCDRIADLVISVSS